MDAAPADFRLLKFSSDEVPASVRFDFWRDIVTRKLLRLAIDPLSDAPFVAHANLRTLNGVSVGEGLIGPSANHRTREIVAKDNDDFVFMANLDGPFVIRRDGDEMVLAPGEGFLTSCTDVGQFVRPAAGRLMCVRLPRASLVGLINEPEAFAGRRIPADSGPLKVLMSYARPISALDDLALTPQMSRAMASHICDLVALSAGVTGEAAHTAAGRGLRAGRLREIKAFIDEAIGPRDFSVDDVAAAAGVSPRYVRKLLESEGLSFSRYVTGRRLERARERLISPRFKHVPISTLAYDVGFGDLSYFNRMFRRRFERTPSDVRANGG